MLDIGTRPGISSVYKMYRYMVRNDDCGGCCGEIEVEMTGEGSAFLNYA